MAGNRAGSPSPVWGVGSRIPPQLSRRHPGRMDADEHFPGAGLGHRSCAPDQAGSIGGIVKAHDSHHSGCYVGTYVPYVQEPRGWSAVRLVGLTLKAGLLAEWG